MKRTNNHSRQVFIFAITVIVTVCIFLFQKFSNPLCDKQLSPLLQTIITINGVFLTLLTTYLIGRGTMRRHEQLLAEEKCRPLFDKLTTFRLICKIIIDQGFTYQKHTTDLLLYNKKYKPILYFDYLETSCTNIQHSLVEELMEDKNYSETETPFCLAVKTLVYHKGYNLANNYSELNSEQVISVKYPIAFIEKMYEWQVFGRMKHLLKHNREMLNWSFMKNDQSIQKYFSLLYPDNKDLPTEEIINKILDVFEENYLPELYGIMSSAMPDAIGTNKIIASLLIIELILGVLVPIAILLFNVLCPTIVLLLGLATIILLCSTVFEIIRDIKQKTTIY